MKVYVYRLVLKERLQKRENWKQQDGEILDRHVKHFEMMLENDTLLLAGKTEQINLMHLRKLELFLQQTELRYLQSPFTLRQETMETNKVAAELLNMEYSQYEELETNKKIAQLKGLFEEPASNIETYIGKLTPHAQRELLWAIIALKVGADEHIISQYETYETIAALRAIYAVAEEFYSQPNAAEIFAKLLSAVPLELQENLFSGTLKMSRKRSKYHPYLKKLKPSLT